MLDSECAGVQEWLSLRQSKQRFGLLFEETDQRQPLAGFSTLADYSKKAKLRLRS